MAFAPAPVLHLTGLARRQTPALGKTDPQTGEQPVIGRRLEVLTAEGGFLTLYVPLDDDDLAPTELPAHVDTLVEVSSYKRPVGGQDDIPPSQRRTYVELGFRAVRPQSEPVTVAQEPRRLRAAGDDAGL